MSRALFLLYLIVEIAAFVAVAAWIGVGWALLALGGLFLVGVVAAAWEMRRLTQRAMDDAISAQQSMGGAGAMGPMGFGAMGSEATGHEHISDPADAEKEARKALASAGTLMVDSAMLMVGCLLLAIPGFVTTIVGLLLILPPTKWLIRTAGGASLRSWFQRTGSKSMFVVQQYGVKYDDGSQVIDHDNPTSPQDPSNWPGPSGSRFTADDASSPRPLDPGTGEHITFDVPDDLSGLDDGNDGGTGTNNGPDNNGNGPERRG
ncbi:FxsA family protein [Corynebacterium sp. NPDC060344]|uniref:FxsA family protein n=1 Tax=Corynebacterium sp. NPDC060344 TaxID=3347101 RepID=UPI0036500183